MYIKKNVIENFKYFNEFNQTYNNSNDLDHILYQLALTKLDQHKKNIANFDDQLIYFQNYRKSKPNDDLM